jgi:hypothetical protein
VGRTIDYYKNKFNRSGWNNSGPVQEVCVRASGDFQGTYDWDNQSLRFTGPFPSNGNGPAVAGQHVPTHELFHGIEDFEYAAVTQTLPCQKAVREALALYFGARHERSRCSGENAISSPTCGVYVSADSQVTHSTTSTCSANPPTGAHCIGLRLAGALYDAAVANSFSDSGAVDVVIYNTVTSYVSQYMNLDTVAYWILYNARTWVHQNYFAGLADVSGKLIAAFNDAPLMQALPLPTPSMSSSFTLTLGAAAANYNYDITFEIKLAGTGGLNYDGSVVWPDSQISLGEHYYSTPISFSQDDLAYHSCGDGHNHGFRITLNIPDQGPVHWYTGIVGCGGSVLAAPGTSGQIPPRFAVRQAIQTSQGLVAASRDAGSTPNLLSSLVRRHGLTALEVDIPLGTASAPIRVTVWSPQGRVVRHFTVTDGGPGTQRVLWDELNDRGERAAAGVYVVLVQHGEHKQRTHFVIPAR